MRRVPVQGETISLLEYNPPIKATVIDTLATQFTAIYDNGTETQTFQFYTDYKDTWE